MPEVWDFIYKPRHHPAGAVFMEILSPNQGWAVGKEKSGQEGMYSNCFFFLQLLAPSIFANHKINDSSTSTHAGESHTLNSVTVKRSYPAKLPLVENQSVMDSVANGDISHPLPILPPAQKVMGVGGETEEGNEIMQAHQEKISVGGSKVGECVVGITS